MSSEQQHEQPREPPRQGQLQVAQRSQPQREAELQQQQQQQKLGEGEPPTRAARRLLSSEDGKPMLSFPVERLLRRGDGGNGSGDGDGDSDGDGDEEGGGFWDSRHGQHHRLRSWQRQQHLENERRRQAREGLGHHANQDGNPAAAATRRRPTRPPAMPPLPATAATEEAARARRRRLDAVAASATNTTATAADDDDTAVDTFDAGITARLPLRSSIGTHFVHAHVGTPPQSVRLIVDTGSYTTAFPCVGCSKCRPGSTTPFWDPAVSTTATEVACQVCGGGYK